MYCLEKKVSKVLYESTATGRMELVVGEGNAAVVPVLAGRAEFRASSLELRV